MLNWKTLLPAGRRLRLTRSLMKERTRELAERLKRATGMRVIAGPFAGLQLPEQTSWGDLAPKLLGTYESELAPSVDELVTWAPDRVINIGCAEGYYAVGLARRLPHAEVMAYDTSPAAQDVCKLSANLNHVTLTVRGTCSPEELARIAAMPGKTAAVLDCEGFERELLLMAPEALRNAAILVECHDSIHAGLTNAIAARYETTHDVVRIAQGARNPNAIALLQDWHEADRWLVMSERRVGVMTWLWMLPRAA